MPSQTTATATTTTTTAFMIGLTSDPVLSCSSSTGQHVVEEEGEWRVDVIQMFRLDLIGLKDFKICNLILFNQISVSQPTVLNIGSGGTLCPGTSLNRAPYIFFFGGGGGQFFLQYF
jgi:hypothetical protein